MIMALIRRFRLSLDSGVRRKNARLRLASSARTPQRPADRVAGDGGLLRPHGTWYPAGAATAGELFPAPRGGPGGGWGGPLRSPGGGGHRGWGGGAPGGGGARGNWGPSPGGVWGGGGVAGLFRRA